MCNQKVVGILRISLCCFLFSTAIIGIVLLVQFFPIVLVYFSAVPGCRLGPIYQCLTICFLCQCLQRILCQIIVGIQKHYIFSLCLFYSRVSRPRDTLFFLHHGNNVQRLRNPFFRRLASITDKDHFKVLKCLLCQARQTVFYILFFIVISNNYTYLHVTFLHLFSCVYAHIVYYTTEGSRMAS